MSNQSAATYQWIDCGNGNAVIPSAKDQTYAATSTGDYAVIVTENGCSDTSSCYNVTVVGISESINNPVLIVYPNPSVGNFQLISDSQLPLLLDVFDTTGKLVASKSNVQSNSTINLSVLQNGIYYLRFVNDESSLTRQVIIQK